MFFEKKRRCKSSNYSRAKWLTEQYLGTNQWKTAPKVRQKCIPQAYYGSEILMNKTKNRSDGDVREDFPGGWQEDKINKFTASGRTEKENEVFNYMKKLAQYRKQSAALTTGKMLQFAPKEGVYTYFRYTDNKTIMVISNTNSKEMTVKTAEFAEILRGPKSAKNVLTDDVLTDISTLKIPANTCWVLEIM